MERELIEFYPGTTALEIEEVFTLRGYMRLPDTDPACPTWLFLPPGPGSPEPVEVRTAITPQCHSGFTAEMPVAEAERFRAARCVKPPSPRRRVDGSTQTEARPPPIRTGGLRKG